MCSYVMHGPNVMSSLFRSFRISRVSLSAFLQVTCVLVSNFSPHLHNG